MQANTPPPLRLNEQDAARLPSRFILLMALLYIVPGLTWRGLWRQEAGSFGVMLTMADGALSDWLMPNVAGMLVTDVGPLPYWIGALFIKIFSDIFSPFHSAQIAIACQDFFSMTLLWVAVYRLGKRDDVQPQRLAFGGEPIAKNYARMLADSAVLLMIATYGIAAHTHDISEGATILMAVLLWLNGAVASLARPLVGRWTWASGLAALGLTLPLSLFVFFVVATLGVLFFVHWRDASLQTAPVVLLFGLGFPIAWYLSASQDTEFFQLWLKHQHFAPLSSNDMAFFGRNIFIFTWPVWPLALWCMWQWRMRWQSPMMVLGVLLLLVPALHLLIAGQRFEESMLFFTPGLLVLAPFGLATLNRGRANIIDWFSLFTFSALALTIWLFWIAAWSGSPSQLAENVYKLAPDFKMFFKWWPFLIAVLVTLSWFAILRWRLYFQPRAIWKSVALSSSGLVMVWVLLATLAMPWLDETRSYEDTGRSLAAQLPVQTTCVHGNDLSLHARGAMRYYANVPFVSVREAFKDVRCPYILTTTNALAAKNIDLKETIIEIDGRKWSKVWSGERPVERKNLLILLRQD